MIQNPGIDGLYGTSDEKGKWTWDRLGEKYGVSRQAVTQAVQNAGDEEQEEIIRKKQLAYSRERRARRNGDGHKAPEFEAVMQFVIEAVAAKQREPELKAELEKYKRGYQNMKEVAESLQKDAKKAKLFENQYKLALQHGEIKEPLGVPGKANMSSGISDFYGQNIYVTSSAPHLLSRTNIKLLLNTDTRAPHNINAGIFSLEKVVIH